MGKNKPLKLQSTIARSSMVDINDIVPAKKALQVLGYYNSPFGIGDYVDHYLFESIENFQRDNNLKVDGVMKPGGETETEINRYLKYLPLTEEEKKRMINTEIDMKKRQKELNEHDKISNRVYNDKYKHALINCEQAQKGTPEALVSVFGSVKKELDDLERHYRKRSLDLGKIKDSILDLVADGYGIAKGTFNKMDSCDNLVRKGYEKYSK